MKTKKINTLIKSDTTQSIVNLIDKMNKNYSNKYYIMIASKNARNNIVINNLILKKHCEIYHPSNVFVELPAVVFHQIKLKKKENKNKQELLKRIEKEALKIDSSHTYPIILVLALSDYKNLLVSDFNLIVDYLFIYDLDE